MPTEIKEKAQPKTIDPQLIALLKDIKQNPSQYSKEKSEALLRPYK
jgi:hypothetical protein